MPLPGDGGWGDPPPEASPCERSSTVGCGFRRSSSRLHPLGPRRQVSTLRAVYEAERNNLATLMAEAGQLGHGLPGRVERDFVWRRRACSVGVSSRAGDWWKPPTRRLEHLTLPTWPARLAAAQGRPCWRGVEPQAAVAQRPKLPAVPEQGAARPLSRRVPKGAARPIHQPGAQPQRHPSAARLGLSAPAHHLLPCRYPSYDPSGFICCSP